MTKPQMTARQGEPVTAEEALAFYNLSADVFGIVTRQGEIIKHNPAGEALFGPAENYTTVQENIHPDDVEICKANFEAMDEGNFEKVRPVRCRTAAGTYRWMIWRGNPAPEGNLVFSIGRDVTDQVETFHRLKQLATIVQNTRDAIIGVGLDNRIISWNRGATQIFGYEDEEAECTTIDQLFACDEHAELLNTQDHLNEVELIGVRKDGRNFFAAISFSLVLDESNKPSGYCLIVRDISERKENEKRMREFYSTVSHELRTPLTSIRGALGLLQANTISADSEDGRELINVARDSADRLIRLINDILDVQKIEAGRMELNILPLAPNDIAQKAMIEVSGMAEEYGIALQFDPLEGLPAILADTDKTIQVIANLLSNAIKFSPAGERVSLRTTRSGHRIRFSITDRGAGIAASQAHKLFGKFQQLDSSDSRKQGGTGLGLAICKALVEQQGGNIGFHNEATGCTFWFDLPCQPKEQQCIQTKASSELGHILIVEDDTSLAHVIAKQLSSEGFTVSLASDIASAGRLLREIRPNAVLLDLGLPDGDGHEVLRQMERAALTDVPIIVVTGSERTHTDDERIKDWIAKPFNLADLLQSLRRALKVCEPKLVAVVDDDASLRKVIAAQLSSTGVACVQAADGREALHLIDEHEPDLLILDVFMPHCDGFEVVRRLRSMNKLIPLLLYTGRDLNVADLEQLRLGITLALTKGKVKEEQFVQTVVSLLQRAAAANDQTEVEKKSPVGKEDDELAELSAEYAQILPQKLTAIREQLTSNDPQLNTEALRAVHSIAGTAGSLGFSSLGKLMARLEVMIRYKRLDNQVQLESLIAAAFGSIQSEGGGKTGTGTYNG